MKSVNNCAYMSMLVAACLFCGCSRGNADGVGQVTAAKTYKPLVGTNAFAVVVADYGARCRAMTRSAISTVSSPPT